MRGTNLLTNRVLLLQPAALTQAPLVQALDLVFKEALHARTPTTAMKLVVAGRMPTISTLGLCANFSTTLMVGGLVIPLTAQDTDRGPSTCEALVMQNA